MRRLSPRESVTINLDGVSAHIECFVRSVDGPVAGLRHLGELDPDVRELLNPGALCYLSFADRGVSVAMRGVATVNCGDGFDLAFLDLEGAQLPERRKDVRVDLATPASLCVLGSDGSPQSVPTDTHTADISMGGALIAFATALEVGTRVRLDLQLDVFPTPIRCFGAVVRQTRTHVGVRFSEMQESDRVRLADVIAEQQRRAKVGV